MCISSNVHTGAVPALRYHPFGLFFRNGFRITLNTDNRLMSGTSLTREFMLAAGQFDLDLRDMEKLTLNAMKSAFTPFPERINLIYNTIKPGYARLYKKQKQGGRGRRPRPRKGQRA
jgi:adenosine deaminase